MRNQVAFDFRHGTDNTHYRVSNAKIERVVLGHGGMLTSQTLSVVLFSQSIMLWYVAGHREWTT